MLKIRPVPAGRRNVPRFAMGALVCAALALVPARAEEIILRHALEGRALEALTVLTARFNLDQEGDDHVTLQDLRAAPDRRQLPALALLDVDDSLDFFATRPRFKPIHELALDAGEKLDSRRFYPLIADAVSDRSGRIEALPLGLSLPALFWNKEAFRKAGLNPELAPATWHEVQVVAGALFDAGSRCPLTSSRFAWVHLENVAAQHKEPMFAKSGRVVLNGLMDVKHLALLSSWNKSSYFRYFGPDREADAHFLSGECAMLTGEASFSSAGEGAGFPLGVGPLPYYDDVYAADSRNVLPDGVSLWLLAGRSKAEYRLAARYVSYLLQPRVQRDWVKATAYLPMTPAAVAAMRESNAPPALLDATERQLTVAAATARPHGSSLVGLLHDVLSEEMQFVWRDEKPAKQALDNAMQRVNVE